MMKNYFSEILGSSQKFVAGPQCLDFKVVTLNDFWLQQCKTKLYFAVLTFHSHSLHLHNYQVQDQ